MRERERGGRERGLGREERERERERGSGRGRERGGRGRGREEVGEGERGGGGGREREREGKREREVGGIDLPAVVGDDMLEKVDGCKPRLDKQGFTDLSGEDRFTKTSQSVVGRHAEESAIKQSMLGTILVILILSRPGGTDGVWAFRAGEG